MCYTLSVAVKAGRQRTPNEGDWTGAASVPEGSDNRQQITKLRTISYELKR